MPASFSAWQAAGSRCSGKAGNGARALMAAVLAATGGTKNWGIYNCRSTALGNPSAHGEGRALDVGCNVADGAKLVRLLLRVGPSKLGISTIIHNRVIYSAKSPGGRRYSGHPHHDHVHIEMTRNAAATLTLAKAKRILAGAPPAKKLQLGDRTLKKGSAGADVTALQKLLNVNADGTFGSGTQAALKEFQHDHGLPADGIAGPRTFAALGVK